MDKQKEIEELTKTLVRKVVAREVNEGIYEGTARNLINAGYGNLKEFAENVIAILDKEMANLKTCEDNLKKEDNHEGAVLMLVCYWEIHDIKEKIAKLIKEYTE